MQAHPFFPVVIQDFLSFGYCDALKDGLARTVKAFRNGARTRVGVDYKSPITITVPIKLSITITITVVIEKAITITIIPLRLRLQLLVYHGNDSRLFIRHVHLQYYHA